MNAKLLKRSVSELQRLTDKTAPLILSEFITMKIVRNTHPVLIESDDCSHIIMPMHFQE